MKFITTCFALAACALALLSAGPAAAMNNCGMLIFKKEIRSYWIEGVRCDEGDYWPTSQWSSSYVRFTQPKGSGRIECEVTLRNGDNIVNVVRVTQNRCVLKAGNIHVRQVSGLPPVYRDHTGSFKNGNAGEVILKGFGENPENPYPMPDPSH